MKKLISFIMLIIALQPLHVFAQNGSLSDSLAIINMNQQIDDNVVSGNIAALDKLYGDDFIFSHGSGKVEGKQSWYNSVAKGSFVVRRHDSVNAELHPGVSVVRGKLNVQKRSGDKISRYWLKYVRVYAYRKDGWRLISHMTTSEFHEPE